MAVVVVGALLTLAVYYLDKKIGLSKKLAALLTELEADMVQISDAARAVKGEYLRDKLEFIKKLFAIPEVRLF
ncbi:hypothetical protein [Alkalimonas sp.]|uniref:hypothetical protein n=1 Tax=Alkalimonas sp. TaxID=1872453 RepID=UPI00263B40E5|nr:hypothetical protein [Alkalimonas sp.]MCC5826906.1 hypothetical protein [Alkalimonas sp.]